MAKVKNGDIGMIESTSQMVDARSVHGTKSQARTLLQSVHYGRS